MLPPKFLLPWLTRQLSVKDIQISAVLEQQKSPPINYEAFLNNVLPSSSHNTFLKKMSALLPPSTLQGDYFDASSPSAIYSHTPHVELPDTRLGTSNLNTTGYSVGFEMYPMPNFSRFFYSTTPILFSELKPTSSRASTALSKNPVSRATEDTLSKKFPLFAPTHYESALMSCLAYENLNDDATREAQMADLMEQGWRLHNKELAVGEGDVWRIPSYVFSAWGYSAGGYIGAVFVSDERKQIVIAHRGSEKKNLDSWLTDIKTVVGGDYSSQLADALTKTMDSGLKDLIDDGYQLSFTGHSLGAFLAEVSTFICSNKHLGYSVPDVSAVTFESPGSLEFMEEFLQSNVSMAKIHPEELDIIHYLSWPNLVNTYAKKPGTVYHLRPELELSDSNGLKDYTLKAHSKSALLGEFDNKTGLPKNSRPWHEMADWPKAKHSVYELIKDSVGTMISELNEVVSNWWYDIKGTKKTYKATVLGGESYHEVFELSSKGLAGAETLASKLRTHYVVRGDGVKPRETLALRHFPLLLQSFLRNYIFLSEELRQQFQKEMGLTIPGYRLSEDENLEIRLPASALETKQFSTIYELHDHLLQMFNELSEDSRSELAKLGDVHSRFRFQKNRIEKLTTEALLTKYRNEAGVINLLLGRTLAMSDIYINLQIVLEKEQTQKKNFQTSEQNQSTRQSSLKMYDSLHQAKTPIKLLNLFDEREVEKGGEKHTVIPEKLLLLGAPGIGKSTLCQYIAHMWANADAQVKKALKATTNETALVSLVEEQSQALTAEKVSHVHAGLFRDKFEWVFWIKLRELGSLPIEINTIPKLLQYQCFQSKLTLAQAEELWSGIDGRKVLWLLDGYDEVANLDETHLAKLLLQRILSASTYTVVTSRPYRRDVPRFHPDLVLENIGYTKADVLNYSKAYFSHSELSKNSHYSEFHSLLDEQSNFLSMAQVPISLELLCGAFVNEPSHFKGEEFTQANLYEVIIRFLVMRYLKQDEVREQLVKFTKNWNHYDSLKSLSLLLPILSPALEILEVLSYEGIRRDKFFFDKAFIKKYIPVNQSQPELFNLFEQLGVLSTDGQEYEFIHLTFQEYFAARYMLREKLQGLDKLSNSESYSSSRIFIAEHKYDVRFQYVWRFVFGMLKNHLNGECLFQRLFHLIEMPPKDLLGTFRINFLLACLSEVPKNWMNWVLLSEVSKDWLGALKHVVLRAYRGLGSSLNWKDLRQNHVLVKVLSRLAVEQLGGRNVEVLTTDSCLAYALGNLGDSSPRVTETLLKEFSKSGADTIVVSQALRILGDASPMVIEALMREFFHYSGAVRTAAAQAIGSLSGNNDEVEAALIKALSNEYDQVRKSAAEALGYLDNASLQVQSVLIEALENDVGEVATNAAKSLGNLGKASPPVVAALMKALCGENIEVQLEATSALSSLSKSSLDAVVALLKVLSDGTVLERELAIQGLCWRAHNPIVSAALVKALGDDNRGIRLDAAASLGWPASALGKWDDSNLGVIKALVGELKQADADEELQRSAVVALGHIGEPSPVAIKALADLLGHADCLLQLSVVEALGRIGEASPGVIKALVDLLDHPDEELRCHAVEVLGRISEASPRVIKALLDLLDHDDMRTQSTATKALGRLGESSPAVIEALVKRLYRVDFEVVWETVNALGSIGEPSPKVMKVLPHLLNHFYEGVREAVVSTLAQLGMGHSEILSWVLKFSTLDNFLFILKRIKHERLPFYFKENRLHFYTRQGIFQTVVIRDDDNVKFITDKLHADGPLSKHASVASNHWNPGIFVKLSPNKINTVEKHPQTLDESDVGNNSKP